MPQATPKVEELFSEALELGSPEARSAFLDKACGDAEIRRRVEELLAAAPEADVFLESPAPMPTVTVDDDSRMVVEEPGTVFGPYRLLEAIGEGGMGTVYMAEQAEPVRRRVALKVVKPGMDSRQVVARFEAERQALALMDHPNIARVLDAGMTPAGRPYFVMELVRGLPITEYCDRHQLSIPERLELFTLVCRAVQHAHQKGVIHRDLKPSNVLVTEIDGVATPKVIDFGVAKATGGALTEKTLFTGFHQFVGTPLYTSPEQAELSGADVDTRSDIYSLGVLLYELLTGTTPFDAETLRRAAFDEMRRIIREEEPPRPSTRLSSLGERLTAVSARRKADPRRLGPSVKGELDWVVMKALEKDRRRRYETANDFAADVMNYLADRPVEAHPPSARYRFAKFARRNRVALTTGGLVAAALLAGTAVSVWQAVERARAAAEARQRGDEARAVVDYLVRDVFGASAPGKGRGRTVTVGELLDRADATVGERFRGQPLLEASVRLALARALDVRFRMGNGEPQAARAAALLERHLGPEHPETLAALAQQATSMHQAGFGDRRRWDRGVDLARRVHAARRRVLGPAHPDTVATRVLLALMLYRLQRHDEALVEATGAEAVAARSLGPGHPTTLFAWDVLGRVRWGLRDYDRAAELLRRSFEGRQRVLGPLDLETVDVLAHRALLAKESGRLDDAVPLFLDALDRLKRVYGPNHIELSSWLGFFLGVLHERHDLDTMRDFCESWLREVLAAPPDPDPYERSRREVRLWSLSRQLATLPEAVPFDAELARRAAAEVGDTTASRLLDYRLGRLDEAEAATRRELAGAKGGGSGWDWMTLALIQARRGDLAAARASYRRATEWASRYTEPWLKPGEAWSDPAFEALRAEADALIGPRPEPD